eukprot:Gb_22258 [translate_table: standard]
MHLDLSWNEFSGGIPETIGSLERLKYLDLSYCGFSGVIPPQLANLRSLQFLDLSESYYSDLKSGSLSWLKNLTGLKHLSLSGIKMEDQQWRENIARLYNLQRLDLSFCYLSGVSPFDFLINLTSLSRLDLSGNPLMFVSSHIPSWVTNHTSLVSLDLSFCNLQGPFPPQVLTLPRLENLFYERQ